LKFLVIGFLFNQSKTLLDISVVEIFLSDRWKVFLKKRRNDQLHGPTSRTFEFLDNDVIYFRYFLYIILSLGVITQSKSPQLVVQYLSKFIGIY